MVRLDQNYSFPINLDRIAMVAGGASGRLLNAFVGVVVSINNFEIKRELDLKRLPFDLLVQVVVADSIFNFNA